MRLLTATAAFAIGALCVAGSVDAKTYFEEKFDRDSYTDKWVISDWKKSEGTRGEWKLTPGDFYGDKSEAVGLETHEDARFYGLSAKFDESFTNEQDGDLVVQFQVKHPQKLDCGGGYIKLLPSSVNQKTFSGDAPYYIMFGPDICGSATKKTHFIINYNGDNKMISKSIGCETDQLSHVYTLIIHGADQSYQVLIDGDVKESGNLVTDFDLLQPKQIKDPNISKPTDWVDQAQIDDPSEEKPADWDTIPATIPDPDSSKPDDWDDEIDGDWEASTIPNPEFKGEWKPKKIPNPDYKGVWTHPMIDNPDYKPDPTAHVYKDIGAVGFELWQVKAGSIFDNIIVTDSIEEAAALRDATWGKYHDAEKASFDAAEAAKREKEEADRKKLETAVDDEDDDDDDEHDEL